MSNIGKVTNDIDQAAATDFEVLVIGGGCVGTAVAMFSAYAGLKTALLERNDFASGTSGGSSELIHGGLQYLFKLRFDIVRKSNEYARRIHRSVSHLCEPLPIVFPCYRDGPIPFRLMRVFMRIYERYNRRLKQAPPSEKLTPLRVREIMPNIRGDGLVGGIKYYEWWIDAPRMCLSNALWAARNGAFVRNHASVVGINKQAGGRLAVTIDDRRSGKQVVLRSKVVINATGPWTDRICELAGLDEPNRIRPTRGVHLLMPRVTDVGLLLQFVDGRMGLILPRRHCSVIGATDDDYYGDLDDMPPTQDEISYLFQGAQRFLSGLSADDIVDTRVACRPTIHKYGQTEDKLPRDHRVDDHKSSQMPGFISVYGGKLATHTLMAEDVLRIAAEYLGKSVPSIVDYRLPGGPDGAVEDYLAETLPAAVQRYSLDAPTLEALIRRYGTEYEKVLAVLEDSPELAENLCRCQHDGQPAQRILAAEIHYAVRNEWAITAQDITRRTGLGLAQCKRNHCLEGAEPILRTLQCPTTVSAAGPAGEEAKTPSP